MIIGTILRYFKTYQRINYIPITDEDKFCELVGDNGIGKSSVLESLDSFFNTRPWNFNTVTKKSGKSATKPQIVPIFLLNKNLFHGDILEKAKILNSVAISISETDVTSTYKSHIKNFVDHRDQISQKINLDELLMIPLGIDYENNISISVFNSRLAVEGLLGADVDTSKVTLTQDDLNQFQPLLEKIKASIDYIYIPREIEQELFTKLETSEIQVLMGETLTQIISQRVPQEKINEINTSLNCVYSKLIILLKI
jgi:hypothetical protein